MNSWTVFDIEKKFPIGTKVKYFLDMSNKDDFHEGVVSSKPKVINEKITVSLQGYVGWFWCNCLELSE
jgi:hypothetical protein